MKIGLFADIHGKFLLPFKLVDLYQKETGNKIDLILQCGDMGAYPNFETLDKATLKHAKNDRDELGFHDDFTRLNPNIKAFLDVLDIKMLCVRGNHEDHDFLDQIENENIEQANFPIDVYQRVWVCKSGWIQKVEINNQTLTFVGIGRIGDRKGRVDKRFIQPYERKVIKELLKTNNIFDILITHDYGDLSQSGFGMAEIREVLDNVIFYYHFYGHTGELFNVQTDENGITLSIKIKELEFDKEGNLPEGCMIILEKIRDGEFKFDIVDRKITNQLTKQNWKDF